MTRNDELHIKLAFDFYAADGNWNFFTGLGTGMMGYFALVLPQAPDTLTGAIAIVGVPSWRGGAMFGFRGWSIMNTNGTSVYRLNSESLAGATYLPANDTSLPFKWTGVMGAGGPAEMTLSIKLQEAGGGYPVTANGLQPIIVTRGTFIGGRQGSTGCTPVNPPCNSANPCTTCHLGLSAHDAANYDSRTIDLTSDGRNNPRPPEPPPEPSPIPSPPPPPLRRRRLPLHHRHRHHPRRLHHHFRHRHRHLHRRLHCRRRQDHLPLPHRPRQTIRSVGHSR